MNPMNEQDLGGVPDEDRVPVKVAVVPCAGLGTRMLPFTRVVPKELLPLGPKPLIEHTLAELGEARFERAIIVVRPDKALIMQHLLDPYPFPERAHSPSPIPNGLKLEFVEQDDPRGLADALKMALPRLEGQPFLMILPDQLLTARPGAATQLVRNYRGQDSLTSLVNVPKEEAELFVGARGVVVEGEGPCYQLKELLGETGVPGLSDGRYTVRAFGRSIFKADFLESIEDQSDESEFSLAFTKYCSHGWHDCLHLKGRPIDVGMKIGYQYFWKHWESIHTGTL
ncbi:MAG: sugar phosphate nucleotidyltransferase [Vulcanimicrobiota bacterium]